MFDRRLFKDFDIFLFVIVLILNFIGLAMIYSSTYLYYGNYYLDHQIYWELLALGAFAFVILIDYSYLLKLNNVVFFSLLVILAYLAFFKHGPGAHRWISIFGGRFSPAEFMKISVILLFSQMFYIQEKGHISLLNFVLPFIITLLIMIFIGKEPDLGTALFFFIIFLAFLYMAGISIKDLIVLLVPLIVLSPIFFYNLKAYQRARILIFLDPWKDVQGAGYNIIQSIISIGSGGFLGKGFLAGTQSQLDFLPAQHTDFIFSVFSEQFGFIGVVFLFILYYIMIFRIYKILKECKASVSKYFIVFGLLILFILHIFVNIGMTIGLLPVTGLTLPFMSYGGSSLISLFIAIGIVENIKMRLNI